MRLASFLGNRPKDAGPIERLARQHDLHFLNTTTLFAERQVYRYRLSAIDGHPNAAANRLWAQEIFRFLRDDLDWGFGYRTVYWDADRQRELLRGRQIMDYRGDDAIAQIAGSVVGYADVLGDWREELIVSVPGELRIYTTDTPAEDRRVCLMQDPLYRLDVCIQAMGYTQCPMTTECLSTE